MEVHNMKQCNNCNTLNEDDYICCKACGNKLDSLEFVPSDNLSSLSPFDSNDSVIIKKEPWIKEHKKVFFIICTILVAIIIFLSVSPTIYVHYIEKRITSISQNVTADSFDDLNKLQSKYDALSDKKKTSISNSQELDDAIEECKFYVNYKYANQNFKDGKYKEAADLYIELLPKANLYNDSKEKFYDTVEKNLKECKDKLSKGYADTIISLANGTMSSAKSLLNQNSKYMSDESIKNCLLEIGRWDSVYQAETYLKDYLKSPSSYRCYEAQTAPPRLEDGLYKTYVKIKYGANNSFNAEVTDTADFYVYFTINNQTLNVKYTNTEFTLFYQTKLYTS